MLTMIEWELLPFMPGGQQSNQSSSSGRSIQFDMTHLGSLFVTNKARNGRFTMQELRAFARLVSDFHDKYPLQEVCGCGAGRPS